MIEIELHHAFVLITAFFLAVFMFMFLYDTWRGRASAWHIAEERLGECARCRMTFIASRHDTVVRCPRCNALCQSSRRSDNGLRSKGR